MDRAAACQALRRGRPGRTMVSLALLLAPLALAGAGCAPWSHGPAASSTSLLERAAAPEDHATLEVYFVTLPEGHSAATEAAWREIDEQSFPADLRERLARNGMRAGLLSGSLPPALEAALDLRETWPERPDGWQTVDLTAEQPVRHRLLQVTDRTQTYIAESEIRPRMPVLWRDGRQTRGRTFQRAQCMFALTTTRVDQGRLEVQLLPEVHHGEPRQKVSGEHGVFHFEFSRPKEVFSELGIRASLAAGEMLIVGRRAHRSGSLGHQFFSADGPRGPVEKLLILRLVGTATEPLFPETLGAAAGGGDPNPAVARKSEDPASAARP